MEVVRANRRNFRRRVPAYARVEYIGFLMLQLEANGGTAMFRPCKSDQLNSSSAHSVRFRAASILLCVHFGGSGGNRFLWSALKAHASGMLMGTSTSIT